METQNENDLKHKEYCMPTHSRKGRVFGGLIIIAVGVVLMAKQMGVLMPAWLFTWPMLLIVIGFYIGVKHSFRNPGWFIMILVGSVFLIEHIIPGVSFRAYFWPVLIICVGLFMMLKPRRSRWKEHHWRKHKHYHYQEDISSEDLLESVSIFGGVKKNIISKNFKGGEVVCVFGGAEINLSQADINGRVVLEATQIFGGTKLIVPPHWVIHSEMVAVLGGVDDKRPLQKESAQDPSKVLVIRGTSVFGGLEIKSF